MHGTSVWMVTSGDYSDYSVEAIYATREVAERAAAIIRSWRSAGPVDVEELAIHDDVDLATEVYFRVPRVRRSGSPTVTRYAARGTRRLAEFRPGEVHEGLYMVGLGVGHVGGWVYEGTDEAAVAACARAQSMAVHGEVVMHE